MLFENLTRIITFERTHLPFVRSREDWQILVAIGNAAESGAPIGFKQLVAMKIASPSTLTRSLKRLIGIGALRRVTPPHDGRTVAYLLSKHTVEAFKKCERLMRGLRWASSPRK